MYTNPSYKLVTLVLRLGELVIDGVDRYLSVSIRVLTFEVGVNNSYKMNIILIYLRHKREDPN